MWGHLSLKQRIKEENKFSIDLKGAANKMRMNIKFFVDFFGECSSSVLVMF